MRVSVIVPVYNPGDYLVTNIECMMRQTGEDKEFIYVDDGSTDSSLEVLKSYQRKDHRIKIISQKNQGPSVARNEGIKQAMGDIIMFVDSDDYISDGSIDYIKSIMQKYSLEVFLGREIPVFSDREVEKCERINTEQPIVETGIDLLVKGKNSFTNCLYTYDKQFLLAHNLFFEPGIIHEDMEYIPKVLRVATRVMKMEYRYYYHVYRENSITHREDIVRSRDLIFIAHKWNEVLLKESISCEEKKYFKRYCAWLCSQAVHVAILNRFSIDDIFEKENERKNIAAILYKGSIGHKALAIFLLCHWDKIYEKVYLMFRKMK